MSVTAWGAFLLAAALGAPARSLVDGWVQARVGTMRPWGTFVVNTSGCFVLGLITGLGLYHGLSPTVRTVVGTGGLGAYTTFSTLTFEIVRLGQEGDRTDAVLHAFASLVVGLAAATAGLALAAL